LDLPVDATDLPKWDKTVFKQLHRVRKGKQDPSDWGMDFSVQRKDGSNETVPLKGCKGDEELTRENVEEYMQLLAQFRLEEEIREQRDAFKRGFQELITREDLKVFRVNELDLLICGIGDPDIEAFCRSCAIEPPATRDHPTIQLFFDLLHRQTNDTFSKMLSFITSATRVPPMGFDPPVNIHLTGDANRLPAAHTCGNTLDLPPYDSIDVMEEKWTLALQCRDRFGFA
jgi:hypothetical protein